MSSTKSFIILGITLLFITSAVYAKEGFEDKLQRLFGIDISEKLSPPVPNSVSPLSGYAVAGTIDKRPPVVGIDYWPAHPYDNETISFTSVAYDESGVSRLMLYVDHKLVKVCFTTVCIFDKKYPAGKYTYAATAMDKKGNIKELPDKEFTVKKNTDAVLWPDVSSGGGGQNTGVPLPDVVTDQNAPPTIFGDTRLYNPSTGKFASNEEIARILKPINSNLIPGGGHDGNQTPPAPYPCKPGNVTTDNACGGSYLAYVPRNCSFVVIKSWGGGGGAGWSPGKLVKGGGGAFAAATFKNPYFNANSHLVDILLYIAGGSGACGGGNGTSCPQGGGTSFVNWQGGDNNTVLIRAGGGGSGGGAIGNYTAGKGGAAGQDGQNIVGKVGPATGGKTGTSNHIGLGGMNGQGYIIPNATDGNCEKAAQGVGEGGESYPNGGGTGGTGGYCGGGEGGRSFNQSQGASAGGGGGGSFINFTTISGMMGVVVPGNWEIPGNPGDPVRGSSGNGGTPANSGGKCGKVHVYWF